MIRTNEKIDKEIVVVGARSLQIPTLIELIYVKTDYYKEI